MSTLVAEYSLPRFQSAIRVLFAAKIGGHSQIPRFPDSGSTAAARQISTFHRSQIPRFAILRARITCFRSCEESRMQDPESQDGVRGRQLQSRITESHVSEFKTHAYCSAQFERIQNPESSVELSVSVKILSAESRSVSWGVSGEGVLQGESRITRSTEHGPW